MMNHTVLLVEDEDDLRELMRDALESEGYAVVTASDGADALRVLRAVESLCLVLLDLLMPGMNGWDFYEAFRALPAYAATPVVVHSSAPTSAPQGVTRVLQKPVKLDRLLTILREYCVPQA